MRRETQNLLLILLGGALLKIGINGDYLRYVKPAQQPWLLGGGAVILLLGLLAVLGDLRAARAARSVAEPAEPADPEYPAAADARRLREPALSTVAGAPAGGAACAAEDGHGHPHSARSAWLLMVPVLAVFLVAPPALGADSVTRTQATRTVAAPQQAAFPPLPAGAVVPLSVSELVARAGWDGSNSLTGRTVELTGFVAHEAHGTVLARLVVSCCAADAFPVTVRLRPTAGPTGSPPAGSAGGGGADPGAGLPADTWIRVTGTVVPGSATAANGYRPDLVPAELTRIPAPADPYEY